MMLSSAATAFHALRLMEEHFFREGLRLGVVAPLAMQWATLQENRRANARPIVG